MAELISFDAERATKYLERLFDTFHGDPAEVRADYWQRDARGEWPVEHEYFVYQGAKLIRVCPSIGMAREVAAGIA